jgi:hypothetical protein
MAVAVAVAMAVIAAGADPVRVPLRGEQQDAAAHVDDAVATMQKDLDRMRKDVKVEVGEEDKSDAGEAPQGNEGLAVLRCVEQHRRTAHRSHKPEGDCMGRMVQPLRTPRQDVGQRQQGEQDRKHSAVDGTQYGRKIGNAVEARRPRVAWCFPTSRRVPCCCCQYEGAWLAGWH